MREYRGNSSSSKIMLADPQRTGGSPENRSIHTQDRVNPQRTCHSNDSRLTPICTKGPQPMLNCSEHFESFTCSLFQFIIDPNSEADNL